MIINLLLYNKQWLYETTGIRRMANCDGHQHAETAVSFSRYSLDVTKVFGVEFKL